MSSQDESNPKLSTKLKPYTLKSFNISAILLSVAFILVVPKLIIAYLQFLSQHFSTLWVAFIATNSIHMGIYWTGHAALGYIYTKKIPWIEKYRISQIPWPWETEPEKFKILLKKAVKTTLIAHLIITPIIFIVDFYYGAKLRHDHFNPPSYFEMIPQLVFCMFCEDFAFYWVHRFLHLKFIYPYIHKKHHEFAVTVSIAAEYAHPIEYLLENLLPVTLGSHLLGNKMHLATQLTFVAIRLYESIHAHSGYEFPFSPFGLLPFQQPASYHYFHHYQNVGCYGTFFTLWDWACGTDKPYKKFMEQEKKTKAN